MTKKEKKERRLKRLAARLTLLKAEPPEPGWSEHRKKMWYQEGANLVRQLKRHGIEVGE